MTTHVITAVTIALALNTAQRILVACRELDGGNDSRTVAALVRRGLFGAAVGGHADARYGLTVIVPGVRSRTRLGDTVARILWGRFASSPTVVARIAERMAA